MNQQREPAGEEFLLQHCLQQIEQQLAWGESRFWTNRDFAELSDRILEKTDVSLSPTTLKRVWGRLQYSSRPSPSTLDTLANYLDYEHWRAYKLATVTHAEQLSISTPPAAKTVATKSSPAPYRRKITWVALITAVLVFSAIQWFSPAPVSVDPPVIEAEDYQFSFRALAEGLPNTVIFDYDASAAPQDSVFIQQSWDQRRRQQVSREGSHHASIYYKPGFYQAKLVVDNQIVQEREVYIRSDAWSCIVEQSPVPVYFPKEVTQANGILELPLVAIEEQGLAMQPQPPLVIFSKVPKLEQPFFSDNFRMHTRLRHDYREGAAICQYLDVVLLLKNGAIIIPLSQAGCVADLDMYIMGHDLEGQSSDLSGFGLDVQQWVDLELKVADQLAEIYVNEQLAFSAQVDEAPKEIVGIRYRFRGTGSVQSLAFWGEDEQVPVWEDNFGSSPAN